MSEPYPTALRRMSPAPNVALISPSDSEDLPGITSAVRCGTGGDLAYIDANGNADVIPDVAAGETIVGQFSRIKATGTTADGITIFYH